MRKSKIVLAVVLHMREYWDVISNSRSHIRQFIKQVTESLKMSFENSSLTLKNIEIDSELKFAYTDDYIYPIISTATFELVHSGLSDQEIIKIFSRVANMEAVAYGPPVHNAIVMIMDDNQPQITKIERSEIDVSNLINKWNDKEK